MHVTHEFWGDCKYLDSRNDSNVVFIIIYVCDNRLCTLNSYVDWYYYTVKCTVYTNLIDVDGAKNKSTVNKYK